MILKIAKQKKSHLMRLIEMVAKMAMGQRLCSSVIAEEYNISTRTFARDMDLLSGIMPIVRDKKQKWGLLSNADFGGVNNV